MRLSPVLREGVQIYLKEGYGLVACFYVLVILAPIEFLTLFLPSLDPQIWTGAANLFQVSSITALILIVYFGLRVANQELAPRSFVPLWRWLREEGMSGFAVALAQLALLCLNLILFLFFSSPLLIWAGAISRIPESSILSTFSLILFYSLVYGVWGLFAAALWQGKVEIRHVFVRCFVISVVFLSALLYLPLNPIAFLVSHLGDGRLQPLALWGRKWSGEAVHFLFHFFILGCGLVLYGLALRRERAA